MVKKRKKGNKQINKICQNCRLFDPGTSTCSIVVLHEGERHRLPVLAEDPCFFEGEFFDPSTKAMENFVEDIKEVKFWVEDENGEKTDGDGVVKIEYPKGFFSRNLSDLIEG
jgi:hypothetical protein